jgi:hypothetical protein
LFALIIEKPPIKQKQNTSVKKHATTIVLDDVYYFNKKCPAGVTFGKSFVFVAA